MGFPRCLASRPFTASICLSFNHSVGRSSACNSWRPSCEFTVDRTGDLSWIGLGNFEADDFTDRSRCLRGSRHVTDRSRRHITGWSWRLCGWCVTDRWRRLRYIGLFMPHCKICRICCLLKRSFGIFQMIHPFAKFLDDGVWAEVTWREFFPHSRVFSFVIAQDLIANLNTWNTHNTPIHNLIFAIEICTQTDKNLTILQYNLNWIGLWCRWRHVHHNKPHLHKS